MNIITVTSDGGSAVVFGNSIIGNSPTELYVSVMTEILKAHPEIIGQKEPHFTSDSERAKKYTGTTREVLINGMTVYINTGLSTKAKIKGIEKTCQLAGIGFEVNDGGAVQTAQATNNAVNTPVSKPSVENDAIKKLEKDKPSFINEEDDKILLKMMGLAKVYFSICKTHIDNNKWYYSLYNNKMLRNIYGNIAQLNYGVKARMRVQDNLGDWEIGQYNTPKGKEQLLKESVPVYEIPQIGKVNAYTFLNLVYENNSSKRKIIYAQNNTIYSQDIDTNEKTEICACNRVVSILAVRELLLVTEITDLRYDGRKSYEFQMGDFGYTSDDYTSLLQLRVINMIGWELLKVDNVDSAIVSAYISEVKEGNGGSKEIVKLELMDIWHNKLILENVEKENYQSGLGGKWSIRKINNIIDVINTNKLSKDKYEKNKNNVVLFNNKQVVIWNEEKGKEYIYNMTEFFSDSDTSQVKEPATATQPVAKQTETTVKPLGEKKSIEEILTSTMQNIMMMGTIMKSLVPSKGTIYAKHENDYELNNFYKDIKRLNYGIEVGGIVHDNLGDWVLGEHKTPKGKEQLLKDSIPVYEIPKIGKVNAYTLLKFAVAECLYKYYLIYAQNNTIYLHDMFEESTSEICKCNNVVRILSARELLLITEISDFQYVGRKEYEFQMGDYGYTSDDYKATLQLRVVNMAGNELIKVDNTNSIISAFPVRYDDTDLGKQMSLLFVTDIEHNCYGLKKNASEPNIFEPGKEEWSFETACERVCVLKENDINYSQYFKVKNNILALSTDTTIVWNDEQKKVLGYDTKEFFKEGK